MKIPVKPYRNPLGNMQSDLEAVKRRGWRDQHVLVVAEDDERLDVVEREIIQRIGQRLYGENHHA